MLRLSRVPSSGSFVASQARFKFTVGAFFGRFIFKVELENSSF